MKKGKLEKYWRLRLPIFIVFMILETLASQALYEHCNLWKLSSSSQSAKEDIQTLTSAEQLRKVMDINKKVSEEGKR